MSKKGRGAQISVIAIVLIILIVIIGSTVIFLSVRQVVRNRGGESYTSSFLLGADIDYFKLIDNSTAEVKITRGVGNGSITGVKFIFEDSNGDNYYYVNSIDIPGEFESRVYIISNDSLEAQIHNFLDIEKVFVYYNYRINEDNEEVVTPRLDTKNVTRRSSGGGGSGGGSSGGSGGGGSNSDSCSPDILEDSFKCDLEDVYYFDNCGGKRGLKENCSDNNETCLGGECVGECKGVDECNGSGLFCDLSVPYNCILNNTNGCYEKENLTECGVDQMCVNGTGCFDILECIEDGDCFTYNLLEIASCDNSPDDKAFTWDYASASNSLCTSSICTVPTQTLTNDCELDCGAGCEEDTNCIDTCFGDEIYFNGNCNGDSCGCDYEIENCNVHDNWYDTGNTQWIGTGECTEKQQKEQEQRDYTCGVGYCGYSAPVNTRWVDTPTTRNKQDGIFCADDGLFCNGNEVCQSGSCVGEGYSCNAGYGCNEATDTCELINQDCTSTVNNIAELNNVKSNTNPGDIICLNSGNYGSVVFTSADANGGWVTYRGLDRDNVKFDSIYFNPSGTTNFYVKIDSVSVEVPDSPSRKYGVQIGKPSGGTVSNVQILNSKIYGLGYGKAYPSSSLLYIRAAGNILIQDNEIYNSGDYSYGFEMENNIGEIIIKENRITDITRSGIRIGGGNSGSYSYLIEGNYLMQASYGWCSNTGHCGGSGIAIRDSNIHVNRNTVVGYWGTRPIRTYQAESGNAGYSNILIENNLVRSAPTLYASSQGNSWSEFYDAGDNFIIRNNTFDGYVQIFLADYADGSELTLKNNIVQYQLDVSDVDIAVVNNYPVYSPKSAAPYWNNINEYGNVYGDLTTNRKNIQMTFANSVEYNNPRSLLDGDYYPLSSGGLCNGYFSWAGNGETAAGALSCNRGSPPLSECSIASDCSDLECNTKDCVSGSCVYASVSDGTSCTNDGLFCTGDETCQTGSCVGAGNPCSSGESCNEATDVCDVGSVVIPQDYVAYWMFDGDFTDSGGSNDGACTSCPVFVDDRDSNSNAAVAFSSDLVNVGSDSSIDNIFSGGGTVSAWVYADSYGGSNMAYVLSKYAGADGDWIIFIKNLAPNMNALLLTRDFSGTNGAWVAGNVLSTGQWIQIAISYDDSSSSNDPIFYVNGQVVGSSDGASPSGGVQSDAAINLIIGGNGLNSNRDFDGMIDDILIYDRILSSTEIENIYCIQSGSC